MCGMAGAFGTQAPDEVEKMLAKPAHRGPAGQGMKNLPNGTLDHTRLVVLDVEGGHQPMAEDGIWITFNGEIYNYRGPASEHLSNQEFVTHRDTEVILNCMAKWVRAAWNY